MEAIDFYRQMFCIRTVECTLLELFSRGKFKGTVHTSIGQEGCAVGTMNAIDRERDVVFSSHRAHGHAIAYGVPLKKLIAEVLGKASGVCRGVGGTQHLHWKNFFSHGIQGGLVPVAVGSALAEKARESGAVVLIFLGDGTMGQGIVYEGFNLAALWNLPLLFVLENNRYAQTTPCELAHAGPLSERARPFGIPTDVLDGNDVSRVYSRTGQIVRLVREEQRPHFLVLETYRLGPHSKGDDVRPREEIEYYCKKEPLPLLGTRIEEEKRKKIEKEVAGAVERIVNEVLSEPALSLEGFCRK